MGCLPGSLNADTISPLVILMFLSQSAIAGHVSPWSSVVLFIFIFYLPKHQSHLLAINLILQSFIRVWPGKVKLNHSVVSDSL